MIGQRLSHYVILEEIGRGAMGVVYRARDDHLPDRDVAIKVLPPGTIADETARRRFRKEALALSRVSHPHIETVHDFDTQEGVDFLVLELVAGVTLAERLRTGLIPEREAARLGAQLAEGLAAAHREGILHRDIKPGNLRVTPDGQLKVLDFGVAKLVRVGAEATTETLTEAGRVAGTLPYMAPEQLRGERVDERMDVYAAGAVLYEMATGERAFPQESAPLLIDAILHQAPKLPRETRAKVSAELERILLKCLEKDPEDRYQSTRELLVDLKRVSTPTPVLALTQSRPFLASRRFALLGGAVAIAAAIALVPSLLMRNRGRPGPQDTSPSIAVLHFQNLSPSREDESFAAGVTEDVITSLSQIRGLRVVSRSAVDQFRGRKADPGEVEQVLGVGYFLKGSIQRVGETLRVTAQLIQTSNGFHLWAGKFDGAVQDIFAIQDSIAFRIAAELKVTLTPEQRALIAARWSQNAHAYAYYLSGREAYFAIRDGDKGEEVRSWFQRALALDRNYAPALVGLADEITREWNEGRWVPGALDSALSFARHAQRLDSTLAAAWRAEAGVCDASDDLRRAASLCDRAIRINPRDVESYATLASIWFQLGQREKAVQASRKGLEIDPYWANLYAALAYRYRYWGAYEEADKVIAQGLSRLPNDGILLLARGWGLAASRQYEEALRLVRPLLSTSLDRSSAHLAALDWLRLARRYAEADSAAQRISQGWRDAYTLNAVGRNWMQRQRFAEAESLFRKAIQVDPNYSPARVELARCLARQRRTDESEAVYRELVQRTPKNCQAYVAVGRGYWNLRRGVEVERWAKKALQLCPENSEAFALLGDGYYLQGRYPEASEAYGRAVALRPDLFQSYNMLCLSLMEMGKFEEAAAAGEKSVALKPDYLDALTNLGSVYLHMNRLYEAATTYERALKIDSTVTWNYSNLGEVYRLEGRPQRALEMYQHAVQIDSTEAVPLYNIALIAYAYLRDAVLTQSAAERLRRLGRNPILAAGALRFLGRAEELRGQPAVALAHYVRGVNEIDSLLRINPNEPDALEEAGYLYASARDTKRASQYAERLVKAQPGDAERMVNAACILAIAGRRESALAHVERAVTAGYRDERRLQSDPDLDGIRQEARFQRALARIE